jgi:bifunctional DNA-binding transcriptional regulator/antitoxin component of YhaV-PrlF toxin-antitoxin module
MTEEEKKPNDDFFFEDIIKKTKTGVTFPKELREALFNEDEEFFFKIIVPNEKNKIILEFLSEEEAKVQLEKFKESKPRTPKPAKTKKVEKGGVEKVGPNWGEYFVYDFKNRDKVQPILESAFYKFAETPINLEDAMGRIKYSLVSFLTATKTENAKLYFAVIKLLIDIAERFNQPNLIDWVFEKIVPNIESKFLYEQALLELLEISLKIKRYEKAELFLFYILKNIDAYPNSELYNIFNSFNQLVKKVRYIERTEKIDILLKEKLLEYGSGIDDNDYKIQIVEFLEDLKYIELAYKLAKEIQKGLPPDSLKIETIRAIVKRLYVTPISENKPNSSINLDVVDDEEEE